MVLDDTDNCNLLSCYMENLLKKRLIPWIFQPVLFICPMIQTHVCLCSCCVRQRPKHWKRILLIKICFKPLSCYFQPFLLPGNCNIALFQPNVGLLQVTHHQCVTAELKDCSNNAYWGEVLLCDYSFDCIQHFPPGPEIKLCLGGVQTVYLCLWTKHNSSKHIVVTFPSCWCNGVSDNTEINDWRF